MGLMDDWSRVLRVEAASYARLALANIKREFPNDVWHEMNAPGDFPFRPRARTPVFYGSFDWHSCVQMHWLLVRLLRTVPGEVPADEIRVALGAHFEPVALAVEEDFITGPGRSGERPYGWGWALMLIHETATWDDQYGRKWASAMAPLGDKITGLYLDWLGSARYPVRYGIHANSANGLSRALPYATARARAGDSQLLDAITERAYEWFGSDLIYPAGWEPSEHDFLSPALAEAELMASVLPSSQFPDWLSMFLPGIEAGQPATLFTPVTVPDGSDGYVSHRHGLNASRAWAWRRLAQSLPPGDGRTAPALGAARAHAAAALPHVASEDYLVSHWLAAYAVLMLS